MKLGNLTIFLAFLTLTGCDCQYHLSGVVLDKITNEPIPDVAIGKTDSTDLDNPFNRKSTTKKKGEYEIYGVTGQCDEITIFFTKDGYQTKKVTFENNSNDTIFLIPSSPTEIK